MVDRGVVEYASAKPFFFLEGLLGFRDMQIPSAATTMTAEDLYSCSPIMRRGCSGSR